MFSDKTSSVCNGFSHSRTMETCCVSRIDVLMESYAESHFRYVKKRLSEDAH